MTAPSSDRAGVRQTIRAAARAGWKLDSVWDGEESLEKPNETEAVKAVMDLDQAHIYFTHANGEGEPLMGWVFFVLGNDPEEVINDYTTNLEGFIEPLTDGWFTD